MAGVQKIKAIPKSRAKTAYGLLNEVKRLILEEPKRYDQEHYILRRGEEDAYLSEPDRGFPDCGTVGCVAGWIATLKSPRPFKYDNTSNVAAAILGPVPSHELFKGLALHEQLPDGDYKRLSYPQTLKHARLGVKHISAFQKKYAKQLRAKKV